MRTDTYVIISPAEEMLLEAALDGNLDQVQEIWKNYKVNIDAQNEYGETAALNAARFNHIDILKYLHHEGADLTISDDLEHSVMHWAQHHNNGEMLEFLENNGFTSSPKI